MKKSRKPLLKSIISFALAIALVMGAVPIDGLVMVALAETFSVSYILEKTERILPEYHLKGNDSTQSTDYQLDSSSSSSEEVSFSMGNDVTIQVKATDDHMLYADVAGEEVGFQNTSLQITVTSNTNYISRIVLYGTQEIDENGQYKKTRKEEYTKSKSVTVDWSGLGYLTRILIDYSDTDPSTFIYYNINYILNGGTNSPDNPDKYRQNQPVNLKNPTRGGYQFLCWQDENGIAVTGIAAGGKGDRTFEAKWIDVPILYAITYDLSGGTLGGEMNPGTYDVTSEPITLINPNRKGYTFLGWTGSNGNSPATKVTIPTGSYGDKSYTANWEKINYTITCHTEGGGNISADRQQAQIGDTVTLTAKPTASGQSAILSISYTEGSETKYVGFTSIGDDKYTFTMPAGNVTANATFSDGMSYVDENGVGQKLTDICKEIAANLSESTLTAGWYFAKDETTISDIRISISGDVKLILCDGAKLSVPKGISLTDGNTLTIYGQTGGSGMLTISGVEQGFAGIGSGEAQGCGTLVINGGVVNVTSGQSGILGAGAGIGGGHNSSGGNITINGGTVTATGGRGHSNGAAGIGGGNRGKGGTVTINGGTVTATGICSSAGIGGGSSEDGGTVTINGGTVTATGATSGNKSGAGIGGGGGKDGNVTINGGRVTAINGIGGGNDAGGTVRLGWTQMSDFIYSDSYRGTVTFSNHFLLNGTETIATADNIAEQKIVPTTLKAYTVRFDKNSDDAKGTMEDMTFVSGKAQALTANTFTREHYDFGGWNTAANGNGVHYTDGQTVNNLSNTDGETVTLYAQWKPIDYNITFSNMANGSVYAKVGDAEHVNSAHYHDTVTLVIAPRDGYALDTLTITPEGGEETAVTQTDGGYSFSMPDATVTVNATFKQMHHFTYTASGATITAICTTDGCTLPESSAGAGDHAVSLTLSATDAAYTGSAYAGASLSDTTSWTGAGLTAPMIEYAGRGSTNYTKSATAPTAVGTYTASITVDTDKTAKADFTISPMALTIDTATAVNRAYDKGSTAVTISSVTFKDSSDQAVALTLGEDNDYTVTGTMADANAGDGKTVDVTVTLKNANYSLATSTTSTTVSISKAAAQTIADVTDSQVYTLTSISKSVADKMPADAGELTYTKGKASTTGSVTVSDFTVNATSGAVTATLSGGAANDTVTLPVTISSTNYADSTVNVVITLTEKGDAGVDITGVPESVMTYGDTDFTLTGSVTDAGTGTGAWTWSTSDTSVFQITPNGATATVRILKAGSAAITAGYESDTTVGTKTTDTITVNTKTLTIAAKDQNIYVGGMVPTLSGEDFYTVTGLVREETLTTNPTLAYQKNGEAAAPDNTTPGTYDIVPSGAAASDNYSITYANGTLTISNKGTQTITAADVTATYGDTDKKISATTDGDGTIGYAVKDGSADYIDVNATTGVLTIKKVPTDGKAYVVVTAAETAAYKQATRDVTVTIGKAAPAVNAPTLKTLTYTGSSQELVGAGSTNDGKLYYAVTTENKAPTNDNLYTTSIPTATDAGTYYVWYKVVGDNNHNDTTPDCVTVSVFSDNSKKETDVQANVLHYDGTAQKLVTEGTAKGGTMMYALGKDDKTPPEDGWKEEVPTGTEAGTYYVWYKVKGDKNHNDTEPKAVEVKILAPISYTVTFKVANGSWDDGTTADKTVKLEGFEGDTLSLTAEQVPAAGSKPAENYKTGAWDKDLTAPVTADTSFTYTYAQMPFSYECVQGFGESYTPGPDGTLTFVFKRSYNDEETFGHFTGVLFDGNPLTRDVDYTAKSGSVIVELHKSFLKDITAGNHTLTALFDDGNNADVAFKLLEAKTYKVTFNTNGHGTAPAAQTVTEGNKATEPAKPTETGYTFGGWYTDKECKNAFDFSTAITSDITLYAKWTQAGSGQNSTTQNQTAQSSSTNRSAQSGSAGAAGSAVPGRTAPATGDTNDTMLWILLMGGAILVICGTGVVIYRKRKSNHR